jgi:hypothetical protein
LAILLLEGTQVRFTHLLQGFLVVAVLCSVGCASKNKGQIEGTKWTSISGTANGQPLQPNALNLEFGTDGKLVLKGPQQSFTGTYSLGWSDRVTFTFDREVEGRKSHVEIISIDGDTLTMSDNTGTVTFKKVK